MLFHILYNPWWLRLYNSKKTMVDYQMSLEGWLENATLFANEPANFNLNFDEFLIHEKANNEVDKAVNGLSDLTWLDEKVDLSIFDDPNTLLIPSNEVETRMIEDAANVLFGLIDSNLDTSYLASDISKIEVNNELCTPEPNSENKVASSVSSDLRSITPDSCVSLAHSPASLVSEESDVPVEPIHNEKFLCIPEVLSPWSNSSVVNSDSCSMVSVTICNSDPNSETSKAEEALSFEEITNSVRKRKYVNDGEAVPKVKVLLTDSFHPYSSAAPKRELRRERKKVQNKEAAARYRVKKRMEEKVLSDEVTALELDQEKLKKKHDELAAEIKYLKSLMCEILEKKGILK